MAEHVCRFDLCPGLGDVQAGGEPAIGRASEHAGLGKMLRQQFGMFRRSLRFESSRLPAQLVRAAPVDAPATGCCAPPPAEGVGERVAHAVG